MNHSPDYPSKTFKYGFKSSIQSHLISMQTRHWSEEWKCRFFRNGL